MADAECDRLVEVVVKLLRLKPERRKEIEAKVVAEEGITSKSSWIDVSVLREALKRTDPAYAPSVGNCDTDASMHSVLSEAAATPLGVVGNACYRVPHTPPLSDGIDLAGGTGAAELTKNENVNAENGVSAMQGKRSAQVFVDISKTGRCTCHVCNEQIAAGSVRCGQDRFSNGITKTRYTHALCFLQCVTCGYAPANRGRCQASGASFARGDLRVKFDAVKTTYWLPEEASTRIFKILEALQPTPHLHAEAVDGLRKMEGLQCIEPHHTEIMLELMLRGGQSPKERLRSAVQTPAKRVANKSHGDGCHERKRRCCAEAGAPQQPPNKMVDLPSFAGSDTSEQPLQNHNRPVFSKLKLSTAPLELD